MLLTLNGQHINIRDTHFLIEDIIDIGLLSTCPRGILCRSTLYTACRLSL
jgi:hypothetical protein